MSPCNPCDPAGCGGVPSGVIVLKKLDYMISDHYTLLGILLISLIILGLALNYFIKSLLQTLNTYFKAIKKKEPSSGDNPRYAADDNYQYYETVKDDPDKVQDKHMAAGKYDFTKRVDDAYKEYNKLKSEYLKTTYNENSDDIIDKKMFYRTYDKYEYKVPDEDQMEDP